jgi:hypothetical protein
MGYIAFFVSELFLLGMWIGLAKFHWWARVLGMFLGITYLSGVELASDWTRLDPYRFRDLIYMLPLISTTVVVTSTGFIVCRTWIARIEHHESQAIPSAQDVQFTLKAILCLTGLIAVLLATGGAVHQLGGFDIGPVVSTPVFTSCAVLAACQLAWAGLGCGQLRMRIPVAIIGTCLVGLIPPYFFGRTPSLFAQWQVLASMTAFCTLASLLVIRSCGYRLARLHSRRTDEPAAVEIGR